MAHCGDERVRLGRTPGGPMASEPSRVGGLGHRDTSVRSIIPRATPILDFYHAAGHPRATLPRRGPIETMTAASLLDPGGADENSKEAAVLRTLEALDPRAGVGWRCSRVAWRRQYVRVNAYRMAYPSYPEPRAGRSGPTESSSFRRSSASSPPRVGCVAGGWGRLRPSSRTALFQSEPAQWEAFCGQNRN